LSSNEQKELQTKNMNQVQAWILEDLIRNMKNDQLKKSKNAAKNKEHGSKLRLLKIKKDQLRSEAP